MKRTLLFAAFIAPAALSACGPGNRGVESVHQPVVARTEYAFDVNAGQYGLAPGESERLAGWMDTLRLGFGDRITLDDPAGNGMTLRNDVAAQAARHGLILADDVTTTGAPMVPGTARIIVSRMSASVPGCPDHSRVSGIEFEASTGSNHGCAINANLAAMVADPGDLVLGRSGPPNDPAVSSKAIDVYRRAIPTGAGGLKIETVGSGAGR